MGLIINLDFVGVFVRVMRFCFQCNSPNSYLWYLIFVVVGCQDVVSVLFDMLVPLAICSEYTSEFVFDVN